MDRFLKFLYHYKSFNNNMYVFSLPSHQINNNQLLSKYNSIYYSAFNRLFFLKKKRRTFKEIGSVLPLFSVNILLIDNGKLLNSGQADKLISDSKYFSVGKNIFYFIGRNINIKKNNYFLKQNKIKRDKYISLLNKFLIFQYNKIYYNKKKIKCKRFQKKYKKEKKIRYNADLKIRSKMNLVHVNQLKNTTKNINFINKNKHLIHKNKYSIHKNKHFINKNKYFINKNKHLINKNKHLIHKNRYFINLAHFNKYFIKKYKYLSYDKKKYKYMYNRQKYKYYINNYIQNVNINKYLKIRTASKGAIKFIRFLLKYNFFFNYIKKRLKKKKLKNNIKKKIKRYYKKKKLDTKLGAKLYNIFFNESNYKLNNKINDLIQVNRYKHFKNVFNFFNNIVKKNIYKSIKKKNKYIRNRNNLIYKNIIHNNRKKIIKLKKNSIPNIIQKKKIKYDIGALNRYSYRSYHDSYRYSKGYYKLLYFNKNYSIVLYNFLCTLYNNNISMSYLNDVFYIFYTEYVLLFIINIYFIEKYGISKYLYNKTYKNGLLSYKKTTLFYWHLMFKNVYFNYLINKFMSFGKREKMEIILYNVLITLKRKLRVQPITFILKLFNMLLPIFDIHYIRKRRKMQPVPRLLKTRRRFLMLFKIFKNALDQKKNLWYLKNKFVIELLQTNYRRSTTFKKIIDLQYSVYNIRRNLYFTKKQKKKIRVFR